MSRLVTDRSLELMAGIQYSSSENAAIRMAPRLHERAIWLMRLALSASGAQPLAISRFLSGLSTTSAMTAATILRIAATTNTACQLPVAVVSTLESGTSNDAVPFAV